MNYDIVEVVIDKLIRTFRLREWQYDIDECVEDIVEALKHIGAEKVFEDKVQLLTINSKVAKLPKDCLYVKHLIPINTPYRESGNFLEIDRADGVQIPLVYQGMPMDERGYPLVPDNPSVREAIMWYLVKVLTLQREVTHISYQVAEQEWQWRCRSARATLNVMDLNSWSKVANDYTRLNPLKDVHSKNYEELGKPNSLDRSRYTQDYYFRSSIGSLQQKP